MKIKSFKQSVFYFLFLCAIGASSMQAMRADEKTKSGKQGNNGVPMPVENTAIGCRYSLTPAANFPNCTDPGDATQLTDGEPATHTGQFWTQPSTVGWGYEQRGEIRIDLGKDRPIAGVSFRTAAGSCGVQWPRSINVLVSTDDVHFYNAGELVTLSAVDHGLPEPEVNRVWTYRTNRLATHGRFVKFVAVCYPFIFVDEIEVYRGPDELLRQAYAGEPVGDMAAFAVDGTKRALEIRRIALDAQDVQRQVAEESAIEPAKKKQLQAELTAIVAEAPSMPTVNSLLLPLNDLHRRVFAVQAELWRARGFAGLTAWTTASPWDALTPTQMPNREPAGIAVTMMQNEFRSAALNLSNPTKKDRTVDVRIEGLPGGRNPSYVTVNEVAWADTGSGTVPALALPRAQRVAEGYAIQIPAGMTRQVWLTFHPTEATAGAYDGTIIVNADDDAISIPVRLRLSSLAFPARPALGLMGWDYTHSTYAQTTEQNRPALISLLKDHFVNITWASDVTPYPTIDFKTIDAWVDRWQGPDYQYHIFLKAAAMFDGHAVGTPEFNAVVGEWISKYIEHLKTAKGIAPERIGLLLIDEPATIEAFNTITGWAKAIKAVQPKVAIWEDVTVVPHEYYNNPAYHTAWSAMTKAVDVLCVVPNNIVPIEDKTWRDAYADAGKPLQLYSTCAPTEQFDLCFYYRIQAWECWVRGASAMGYWAFSDQGGAASWKTDYPTLTSYAPLYLEPNAITDSKQMDAIREGIEDYEYLRILKSRVAELKADGCDAPALADAEQLLDAVNDLLKTATSYTTNRKADHTIFDRTRLRVLDTLEILATLSVVPRNRSEK